MHHIVLWKWNQANFRETYTSQHVNIVRDMLSRHMHDLPYRVVLVTDDPKGVGEGIDVHPLWSDYNKMRNRSGDTLPSCYRRLKLFDVATQKDMGIDENERIVSLDLDTIIAGDLRPLLTKEHPFVGWAVRGRHHPRVFNGSMWMFTSRTCEHMWKNFHADKTPDRVHRAGYLGSDQSWLSYNFARDPASGSWAYPQAVSYPLEVAKRPRMVAGTSVVFFHGRRKPWHDLVKTETPWTTHHWRLNETETQPVLATA